MNRIKNCLIGMGLIVAVNACTSQQAKPKTSHDSNPVTAIPDTPDTPEQNNLIIKSLKLKREIEDRREAFAKQIQEVCDMDKEERKTNFSNDLSPTICNDQQAFVNDAINHCSPSQDYYLASCEGELSNKRAKQLKELSSEEIASCRSAVRLEGYNSVAWRIDYSCLDASSARRLPDFTDTKQNEIDCLSHQSACLQEVANQFKAATCNPDEHFTFHTEPRHGYQWSSPSVDLDHVLTSYLPVSERNRLYGEAFKGGLGVRVGGSRLSYTAFDYSEPSDLKLCVEQDYNISKLKIALAAATTKIENEVKPDDVGKCTVENDKDNIFQTECLQATAYRGLPSYLEYMVARNNFTGAVNKCANVTTTEYQWDSSKNYNGKYKTCKKAYSEDNYGNQERGTSKLYDFRPFFAERDSDQCN